MKAKNKNQKINDFLDICGIIGQKLIDKQIVLHGSPNILNNIIQQHQALLREEQAQCERLQQQIEMHQKSMQQTESSYLGQTIQRYLAERQAKFRDRKIVKGTQSFQFKNCQRKQVGNQINNTVDNCYAINNNNSKINDSNSDDQSLKIDDPSSQKFQQIDDDNFQSWEDVDEQEEKLCIYLQKLIQSNHFSPKEDDSMNSGINAQQELEKPAYRKCYKISEQVSKKQCPKIKNAQNIRSQQFFNADDQDYNESSQNILYMDEMNLHEYLCLQKQIFKNGQDYGMLDQSQQKTKKKKKRKRNKKNKKANPNQETQNLRKSLKKDKSRSKSNKSNQISKSINKKSKQAIKFISKVIIDKNKQKSCFFIDNSTLSSWMKQSNNHEMKIEKYGSQNN